MLKALLWDVDGTIAETERDGHRVAFNLAFAELGLDWGWDERRYGELLHVTGGRERLLADMRARADAPASATEREDLVLRLHAAKNRHYAALVAQGRIDARPGVLGLMREAAAAGLRQAIVTTTSRSNVDALMPRLLGEDWPVLFEAVLCGEDVARKKPDPEVYDRALARLRLDPSEALAIEDSTPGGQAAQAAAVPVMLRPSVYFPAVDLPGAWRGWICAPQDSLGVATLRERHAACTALAQRGV
ncbi:HAD-IA family hydrolase [Ideonella sp. 4Y11]|uniref:HAD-IA family hydrolase n=1 Tax=Ideonella aquatica TaxID=2824119 RepID=A0A940YRI1_9BURK|nr:HAD-IA family hydrolase [Ideonella aquatica]MBQ0961567.1 HAD-IA family hydrolase [Ideonella aquatica]